MKADPFLDNSFDGITDAQARQWVLSEVGEKATVFFQIVERTQLPKSLVIRMLDELIDSGEIMGEQVDYVSMTVPAFRRLENWGGA